MQIGKFHSVVAMGEENYKSTDWMALQRMLSIGIPSEERSQAIDLIKDAIIGSNQQKYAMVASDLVPEIINICQSTDSSSKDKLNAFIILASLAKGSQKTVDALVTKYDIVSILVNEITFRNENSKIIEICLGALKSLCNHQNVTIDRLFADICSLSRFLSLASNESSLKTKIYVISILFCLCQSFEDQMRLLKAGTLNVLARLISIKCDEIQIPALRCLAHMSYKNRSVADNICVTSHQGISLPDILNTFLCRLYDPEIQITAAKCLTYIYRCGTLPPQDHRIVLRTLPTLSRLCLESYDQTIREAAAGTLAYLTELDSDMQYIASISNSLLTSLAQLLHSPCPSTRQAALVCFASLGANEESIRKRIMNIKGLMETVLDNLTDSSSEVQLASMRCLHSLSRSVQQLRTSFHDHLVWKQIMKLLATEPKTEFLIVISSVICNLLLDFSPSKEPLLHSGIIEKLSTFLEYADLNIRLNSIWALMNMSFQAEERVKTRIISVLGAKRIVQLLGDPNEAIVLKTLGLLRNLMSKPYHIEYIINVHSTQVLESVNYILNSEHSVEIKEQVLCIIGNIAAASPNSGLILNDNRTMANLAEYLFHPDAKLQAGCLYAINNIVQRTDSCLEEKYFRLTELDIIKGLCELNKQISSDNVSEDYIIRILKQIVIQCKAFCPEIIY